MNTAFRCEQKPETFNDCLEYYVHKLKNIFNGLNIIKTKIKQINKTRKAHYTINRDKIKYYFDLHYFISQDRKNIDKYLLEEFKNEIKIKAI
jgi:hypothetical protein